MTLTLGGVAVFILAFLIFRGGTGRLGIVVSAIAGAAIGGVLFTLARTAFSLGGSLAAVFNGLG